jgi:hypothetical protein
VRPTVTSTSTDTGCPASEAEGAVLLDAYLDGRSKDNEEPTNRVAT